MKKRQIHPNNNNLFHHLLKRNLLEKVTFKKPKHSLHIHKAKKAINLTRILREKAQLEFKL